MRLTKFVWVLFIFITISANTVSATPINLTDTTGGFVLSDQRFVNFGPNSNDATLTEDDISGLTWLSNDPFLGDPGIWVPINASTLTFSLAFSTSGNDSFEVKLLNSSGGTSLFSLYHDGNTEGAGLFEYNDVSIDLVSLNLLGNNVGIEFVLVSSYTDFTVDAILSINNVSFNENLNPVPEPSSLLLFCYGAFILRIMNKKLS